jgi:3-methyladenine DNA glycosylase AlkD
MLHPEKARVGAARKGVPGRKVSAPGRVVRRVRQELRRAARRAEGFDARRYFRAPGDLGFYHVGTAFVRELARAIHREHSDDWTVLDAMAVADLLMQDRFLETKGVGIELVARYRRAFVPPLLPRWRRWLAAGYSGNWATTDAICGSLIGPLLVAHPRMAPQVAAWAGSRNLWIRRASAVGLIPLVRRGGALELVYRVAARLHADRADLIQKAVGWLLREAGKRDASRLERYLRRRGSAVPRTTVRYAIERFPAGRRKALLSATRRASRGTAGRHPTRAPML